MPKRVPPRYRYAKPGEFPEYEPEPRKPKKPKRKRGRKPREER